jgi:glycosyltransferase involved in cell wall biosynthesis
MLSAEHSPLDKRVFQKEGISLAAAGFDVVHLCPDESVESKEVSGVRLVTYTRPRGKIGRLRTLPRLLVMAWRIDADAYHCNEPDSWLVGVLLRLLRRKHVVFDCHEYYPGHIKRGLAWPLSTLAGWATKYYLQLLGLLTHRIVLAKYSVQDDFSWSRGRQVVVLNTTPLKSLEDPPVTAASEKESAGPFTFAHIGVIRRERGSEQLLEAIRVLDRRGIDDFRVRIIGEFKDGSEADFFERSVRYGVRDRIEFHRWLPFDEAFSLVRQSHAGVILFQKSLENNVRGMPHKMFDYMLAGLPVIAPDFAPDIVGVLDPSGAGFLIDTAEPEQLADAMQTLIEDRQLAQKCGRRGRQAVFDRYNWEHDAKILVETYHELFGTAVDCEATDTVTRKAA